MTMSDPQFDPSAEKSLGAWLRNARIEQGIDLMRAARRIRTRTAVIQALEEGHYQSLGAPVFIRMYLLRYAESLGLAEHETLGRFKALGIDQPPPLRVTHPLRTQTRASDLRWLSYPAAFALIGWLGWTVTQQLPELNEQDNLLPPSFELTGIHPDQLTVEATPLAASSEAEADSVAADPDLLAQTEDLGESELLALAGLDELASVETVTPPLAAAATPVPPLRNSSSGGLNAMGSAVAAEIYPDPQPSGAVAPPDPPPNRHELVLEFTADCWVEVEDADGHRLIYDLINANQRRVVQGAAPFNIRLGNAQAARITLNGQTVERSVYLPNRGSVSRFTLQAPAYDPHNTTLTHNS